MPIDHSLGEFYDDGSPFDISIQIQREAIEFPPVDETDAWQKPCSPIVSVAGHALRLKGCCDSPIEVDFGAHLNDLLYSVRSIDRLGLQVEPQFRWLKFRMDFALLCREGRIRGFVECDGKEFHSTPDQIENDRLKDEAARAAGIPLFRFTGSEIYRSPYECAANVLRSLGVG